MNSTVWKTQRYQLHKQAYHIQTVYKLEAKDYAAWQGMCCFWLEDVDNDNLMWVKSSCTFS